MTRLRTLAVLRAAIPLLGVALLCGCVTIDTLGGARQPLTESVIHGDSGPKLLLVPIEGEITSTDTVGGLGLVGREATTARLREQLDRARAEGDIQGLLLRIDSPGGSVTASDIVYHELLRFKQETGVPVVAELMNVAASGGYYAAMAADEVIAHPTTVTGSIGVVLRGFNFAGLLDKVGVADQTITSGDYKDIGSGFRPMTPEERAILQDIVNAFHARFREVVVAGRPELDAAAVAALADGRVFAAGEAQERGLVDGVGYLQDAIEAARERAGLEEVRVVTYHRPREWRENLYSSQAEAAPSGAALLPLASELLGGAPASRTPGFYYLWEPSRP